MRENFEKAMKWTNDAEQPFVKGVELIHQKFISLLEAQGVLSFQSVGLPFNHHLHEAVAVTKHDASESGTVVDELRRGYLLNNELLRHAQVRVAE